MKKVTQRKERIYLDHLLKEIIDIKQSKEPYPLFKMDGIPKNIAPIEKPTKEKAMKTIRTRFL